MAWRGPAASALLVEPLDVLTAVFHRPSGTTHLLAEPAPEILRALAGRVLALEELLDAVRRDYDVIDADPAVLAARLDELAEAGLIEVVRG